MCKSHTTGVTRRIEENVTMFIAESHIGHKRCRHGGVFVNTMWVWTALPGVSMQSGVVVSPNLDNPPEGADQL